MRIHPKRSSLALVMGLFAALSAVGILAACGGNTDATGSTTQSSAATSATTTTVQQSFVSDLYGYSVDSWTGTSAQTAWDGTGSPGDGDSTVDSLSGPELQRAFGFAEATKDTGSKLAHFDRELNAGRTPMPPHLGRARSRRRSGTARQPLHSGGRRHPRPRHERQVRTQARLLSRDGYLVRRAQARSAHPEGTAPHCRRRPQRGAARA